MKVNYGVNRKVKGRFEHKNGSLDLPEYTNADWDNEEVKREIRDRISAKHPGWIISGYCIPDDQAN